MASPLALSQPPFVVGRPPVNSPGVCRPPASRRAIRTPGATPIGRPVRLTRRGRAVAVAASVLMLGAVVIGAGQVADASSDRGPIAEGEHSSLVVQSGQTLWGIALEVAPGHDPRLVISQIRDLNGLGTRLIVPGQTLIVPTLN